METFICVFRVRFRLNKVYFFNAVVYKIAHFFVSGNVFGYLVDLQFYVFDSAVRERIAVNVRYFRFRDEKISRVFYYDGFTYKVSVVGDGFSEFRFERYCNAELFFA